MDAEKLRNIITKDGQHGPKSVGAALTEMNAEIEELKEKRDETKKEGE